MKTIDEYKAEQAAHMAKRKERRAVESLEKLAEIKARDIPACNEKFRDLVRERISARPSEIDWAGLACSKCATEVVYEGGMLLSNPPKYRTECPGCGDIDSVPL